MARARRLPRGAAALIGAAIMCGAGALPGGNTWAQSDTTGNRLDRIEQLLDNKGLLELVRQVEMLQQEVRQLRGELENQNFALEQLRKGQRDVYTNLDQRIVALEQAGPAELPVTGMTDDTGMAIATDPPLSTLAAPGDVDVAGAPAEQSIAVAPAAALPGIDVTDTTPPARPAQPGDDASSAVAVPPAQDLGQAPSQGPGQGASPGASTDNAASQAAYSAAFGMLKAGQYEDSIAAFNAYLQQYPYSQYADNAQYWLGEAYYVLRQFEPAIEQYQKLVANYPDSQKQSHALLKIAYSYSELGLPEQALQVLGTLKTRFPGSAAARLADERIQRLRAQAP